MTDGKVEGACTANKECGCDAGMFVCHVCGKKIRHNLSGQPIEPTAVVGSSLQFVHADCEPFDA